MPNAWEEEQDRCKYCLQPIPKPVDTRSRRARQRHFDNCVMYQEYKEADEIEERRAVRESVVSELEAGGFTREQAETLYSVFKEGE